MTRWQHQSQPEITPAWAGIESYHHLFAWREHNPSRLPNNCLYVGMSSDIVMATANTNLLVLGPAQGGGKTSGNVVAQALCARGPIVVTSSKGDILAPIAMARSLLGKLWYLSPDAGKTPPGTTQLRWSPVPQCRDWGVAQLTASAMVEAAHAPGVSQSENSNFFKNDATLAIACVLYYAAHFEPEMRFVRDLLANPSRGEQDEAWGVKDMVAVLQEKHQDVANALAGLAKAPDRQFSAVFSTAAQALRAYSLPSVMEVATDPNFDMDAFVAGQPDAELPSMNWDGDCQLVGSYDTIVITASEQPTVTAPIIAAFIAQLRSRRRKLFRLDNDPDEPGRPNRPPLTFILDELATMAPLYDLPEQLAIGNEGVITVGVLQDLSQAKRIWGTEQGLGMLTLFQNVIIFRGIRDYDTLRAISELAGHTWVQVQSVSEGSSTTGFLSPTNESYGTSTSQQLVPSLPIDVIAKGHPKHPDAVLWLRPEGGYSWVHNAPYFRSQPWVPVLVQTMEDICRLPISDPRRLLRRPRLFHGYSGRPYGLWVWEGRYWQAMQALDRTKDQTVAALKRSRKVA